MIDVTLRRHRFGGTHNPFVNVVVVLQKDDPPLCYVNFWAQDKLSR